MNLLELETKAIECGLIQPETFGFYDAIRDFTKNITSCEAKQTTSLERTKFLINMIEKILSLQEVILKKENSFTINLSALSIVQEERIKWEEENFPGQVNSPENYLLGVTEEVGELCHSFLKRKQQIRLNENHDENIKDAVADIMIFLAGFCNTQQIDMEQELRRVWNQVKRRNWKKNNINGVADKSQLELLLNKD